MDTKALRQKILDLAIHGKLVPQDPSDEPASVLLERIRTEKERLIKEGKIKRSKKSTTASDAAHIENVPFVLPESWEWCRLEDCCHIVGRIGFRGYTRNDLVPEGKGAITLSPSNIFEGNMDFTKCTYISWAKYEESPEININEGDILLVKTGSYGKCALVRCLPFKATINPQFVVLKHICIDNEFLISILQSKYAKKKYDDFVLGTAIPTFTQVELGNMLIPLPPLPEQHRIVAEIEKWFALIDQIEQGKTSLQTTIKQTKSKILDLAIHGRLVPQDPSDEPAIELLKRINPDFTPCDNGHNEKLPQGWMSCQLSNVLKITMGQSPKGDSLNNNSGIEFHQGKICFSDKYLQKSEILTDEPIKITEPNSVLLCVRAPVGVVNITKTRICIGRGLCSLSPFEGNSDFYFYLLQTLQDSFVNQSTGTTFKAISGETIKNEKIILPPLPEQHRIAAKIEELFSALDSIQKALEA